MKKKTLINKLIDTLEGADERTSEGFKAFDVGVAKLKSQLKETIQVGTLDEVNDKLNAFKKKIDLEPLMQAVEQIKQEVVSRDTELTTSINERLEQLRGELSEARGISKDSSTNLQAEINKLEIQLTEVGSRKFPEFPDFLTPIKQAEERLTQLVSGEVEGIKKSDQSKALKKLIEDLEEALKKLRIELIAKINERGGGNMNRAIYINGVDPLKKYTDINLKAGSNVTLTYVNNEATKKVDITISSTGGGGGSTRSINNVSISTAAGSASGTDYVYICSGTLTITMPPTVGNTNLYTIKNAGTGVITIVASGADTLDNDVNIIMPLRYTSVDLISDGVSNWNIT